MLWKSSFSKLGLTEDYFRIKLAVAKILGALALILPLVPKWIKNFAYADLLSVSAIIAQIVMEYNAYGFVIFLVVALAVSYYSFNKLSTTEQTVVLNR